MDIYQTALAIIGSDSENYPTAGVKYKGKATDIVRQSVYGVCSNPPAESNGLLFKVNGDSSTKYAILDYMTGRFKNLDAGEVQLGNYLTQASIKFDKDGNVTIDVPSGNLTANVSGNVSADIGGNFTSVIDGTASIQADSLTINASGGSSITGNLNVNGTITATGNITGNDLVSSGISVSFNSHIHTGDSGGNTGIPK